MIELDTTPDGLRALAEALELAGAPNVRPYWVSDDPWASTLEVWGINSEDGWVEFGLSDAARSDAEAMTGAYREAERMWRE